MGFVIAEGVKQKRVRTSGSVPASQPVRGRLWLSFLQSNLCAPQPSKGQEAGASPHSQGSRAQKEGLSWASSGLAPTGPAKWGRNLVLVWNVPAFPEMPPFTP